MVNIRAYITDWGKCDTPHTPHTYTQTYLPMYITASGEGGTTESVYRISTPSAC